MMQAIPIFRDAHLLRRDMLEALSDYAYLSDQLLYKGYGDGILAGCELTTTAEAIVVNPGVVFFAEQMFLIKEEMSILYRPTNRTTVLKLHFSEQAQDRNLIYREINLLLTEQTEMKKGEFELGRFKLQEGARLRFRYQGFEDRNTEFDTLNRIHTAYAAKGGSTLAPEILENFAQEMLASGSLSDFDKLFCIQILSMNQPVNKAALVAYIQQRNRGTLSEDSNLAVYQELVKILKEVDSGRKAGEHVAAKKRWHLTVE